MSSEIAVSGNLEIRSDATEASSDDQLIALWLHGRSRHTQRAYLADVERFGSRAGKTLASVTLADLQGFAASLEDLAPATRYRALSAVKSLLAFGHRIGYLPFDVGRVLRLPSFRNRLSERILPEAHVHRMLSLEPHNRNRALLTLLYASGIRVSELCALCWRDLQPNGDGGQITVVRDQLKLIAAQCMEWMSYLKRWCRNVALWRSCQCGPTASRAFSPNDPGRVLL